MALIKAVLPHMRLRRAGHIVNITSMGGMITMPGISYYHASKFALVAMEKPPAHLLLGTDALRLVSEKLDALRSEIEAHRELTLSTDLPD